MGIPRPFEPRVPTRSTRRTFSVRAVAPGPGRCRAAFQPLVEHEHFAGPGLEVGRPVAEAEVARAVERREEGGPGELAVAPVEVDGEAAPRLEALDRPAGPGPGEGGQELDLAGVALEEHLGDAGGAAEV